MKALDLKYSKYMVNLDHSQLFQDGHLNKKCCGLLDQSAG